MTTTTPKERPILFSAPMVRALLDGRKTHDRRIVKPQPPMGCGYVINGAYSHALCYSGEVGWVPPTPKSSDHRLPCPYGKPLDRLWVKETWAAQDRKLRHVKPTEIPDHERINYAADFTADEMDGLGPWRPCLFMRRWMSRITLKITSIRVERLNDISEEDALAEGITGDECMNLSGPYTADQPLPSMAYANLWESINGKGSFSENPYVWVIEFRRVA